MKPIARGLAMAALTLAAQLAYAQTMYRVVEIRLGSLGDPLAMDSNGKVLQFNSNGSYYICGKVDCRHLPRVRDGSTHWTDFNDQGVLTGYGSKPNGGGEWALRKDPLQGGGARYLTPGSGSAIAPDGAVVGTRWGHGSGDHAFLFTDHYIELGGLAGWDAEAWGINSLHAIVGRSKASNGAYHATLWLDGGSPQDLGTGPDDIESDALAINDAGVAAGYSTDHKDRRKPAQFFEGGVQVFLLPHADDYGTARDINAVGTIVAGIVEGDRMVDLNTRLRPEDALRYNLWTAEAINDAGQIAALHVDPVTRMGKVVRLERIAKP
jgi:probable HAF family extracellular repeat protein